VTGVSSRDLVEPGEWMIQAACRGSWADMYPADGGDRSYRGSAKALCVVCPVRRDCLRYAMATERSEYDRHGVWGGLAPEERQGLAEHLGLPSARAPRSYMGRQPIEHGTPEGARAHYRRGEKPCPPCARANRLSAAESREKSKREGELSCR